MTGYPLFKNGNCERCGVSMSAYVHGMRRFCTPCGIARMKDVGGTRAHAFVHRAVKAGKLPPVHTQKCVDCGAQACDYDHRDYAKPLDVEPVCRGCNRKRGPARPRLDFELPEAA